MLRTKNIIIMSKYYTNNNVILIITPLLKMEELTTQKKPFKKYISNLHKYMINNPLITNELNNILNSYFKLNNIVIKFKITEGTYNIDELLSNMNNLEMFINDKQILSNNLLYSIARFKKNNDSVILDFPALDFNTEHLIREMCSNFQIQWIEDNNNLQSYFKLENNYIIHKENTGQGGTSELILFNIN